ncbi:MAG: ABC transporter ATP-binding protein [Actinobacteria bacterium]|nr:ABC transporter ATP-binding protein [Actinomycetota bacterium]
MNELLKVNNLKTYFRTENNILRAVDGISFEITKGEMVGLVGESGSGKSVTALSILKLISPPGYIAGGEIFYNGYDLLKLSEKKMQKIRGKEINMIFQKPMTSINPVISIGNQLIENIITHQKVNKREAERIAIEFLDKVGIADTKQRLREYAHQFSGGMCQRIMIAMALCCNPGLLIADEPTTALDVTIQAQVLDLLKQINKDFRTSILLITHNLGLVFESCSKILVMYAGQIVEYAETTELFNNTLHPYTKALLKCVPKIEGYEDIVPLEGKPPVLTEEITGCEFAPRCKYQMDKCFKERPPVIDVCFNHKVRCFKCAKKNRENYD